MASDRILLTAGLLGGDVLLLSTQMMDKKTGREYWWRRFACVTQTPEQFWMGDHYINVLFLHWEKEGKERLIDLREHIVRKVELTECPQGVVAMRMKAIALEQITVDSSV